MHIYMGSIVRVWYCIPVPDFYLVLTVKPSDTVIYIYRGKKIFKFSLVPGAS